MLASLWGFLYSRCLRFWLKWLVRLLTGKCELQRLFLGKTETHRNGGFCPIIKKCILHKSSF
uniref:Uncharacterized protein n=1 Tax=Nothoprocta perdicaria TaxID=30464 RepID=A0A8C6Z4C0_NOTPE